MYNIALVEDEKDLNDLIKTYLEKEGYNVTSYYNGDTAIKDSNKDYHLWILDIMLGDDISGYDIIKKIREDNNDVPVIFTSARDKDLDKIIGLELGSDDYITKPYSPKELVLRVNNIIRRVYTKERQNITYKDYLKRRFKFSSLEPFPVFTRFFSTIHSIIKNRIKKPIYFGFFISPTHLR